MENFDVKLKNFVDGCNKIVEDYFVEMKYTNIYPEKLYVQKGGRKYAKVVNDSRVHCFINKENGDVLKAACYNAPAKHARGNIYNDDNGLDCMGPFGAAYLRG